MPEDLKVDESMAFDLVTMGKSHRQKIRCQIACAYISTFQHKPSDAVPWDKDLDIVYNWVMKDE